MPLNMVWNKNFLVFTLLFCFAFLSYANDSQYVIVSFKDKDLSKIVWEDYYSSKSLERRLRQGLDFNYHDYPIQTSYITSLINAGYQVVDSSRWLNAALVLLSSPHDSCFDSLSDFSFVNSVEYLGGRMKQEQYHLSQDSTYNEEEGILSSVAIKSIGLDTLHQEGYLGKDITIAIIDAGFKELQHLQRFQHLYEDQILGERNFIDSSLSVYSETMHGTKIMSLFSCKNGQELIGGSPKANFWLLVSEAAYDEYPLEEFYYVKALEFCDSVGVDIVNASIGYNRFDSVEDSYQIHDLYTKRSISSRASSIAASKGILLVTSAGNEGTSSWKEVTIPADADSIIAVGAANFKGEPAYFASYGREGAQLVRPNLSAPGDKVYTLNENGRFTLSYGSSYAAPLISAAIACLWEKYPSIKAYDMIQYLEQTATHHSNPELQTGYGFPDLKKLLRFLDTIDQSR